MSIMRNTLYKSSDAKEHFRVLHVDQTADLLYAISLMRKNSLPYPMQLSLFLDEVQNKYYIQIEDNVTKVLPGNMTEKQQVVFNMKWDAIKDFVLNEPACYDSNVRGKFIAKTAAELNKTRMEIQRWLYAYWAYGMTPNALIPEYRLRGGQKINISKPIGRPPVYGTNVTRHIITKEDIRNINRAVNQTYNLHEKFTMKNAYTYFLNNFYTDTDGKLLPSYPSMSQFRYRALNIIDQRKRLGTRKFEKDLRGITGSSRSEADGPGDKYQIDATVGDIYLVSAFNKNIIIGRPVIYFVTDVFSRMITGFYVGLDGPSWVGAMTALSYAFMDKVKLCEMYGVTISEEQWPCKGLPRQLLVDNGELVSKNSDNIIERLGITVQNTAAWRPDLKGIVESRFRLLNISTKMFLPGAVLPDFKERGDKDYRLDAKLDILGFAQMIIYFILNHNQRLLSHHPQLDDDVLADNVPEIPIELWNWGIRNRSGQLRQMADDRVQIALMHKDYATVTEKGIKFMNLYFTCETALQEEWFSAARMHKTWRVPIAYDPRNMDNIYLLSADAGETKFEVCKRTASSKNTFKGWQQEEIIHYIALRKSARADLQRKDLENTISFEREIQKIIDDAERKANTFNIDPFLNHKSTKNIRSNRKAEREALNQAMAFTPDTSKLSSYDAVETMTQTSNITTPISAYSAIIAQIMDEEDDENE